MFLIACCDPRSPSYRTAMDRPYTTAEAAHAAVDAMGDDARRELAQGGWRVKHVADIPRRRRPREGAR
jgi:hypothetical protein